MNSQLNVYNVCADSGELSPGGTLKLQGYHELICDLIEQNEIETGSSIAETIKQGYAWAIISLSMEVLHPVSSCEWLDGQTWLSEAPGGIFPYYRREVVFYNKAGETMFSASLFLVKLDTETHKIVSTEDERVPLIQPFGKTVEWAAPRLRDRGEYSFLHSRSIYPSDIDALGHLNNCRYGAFTYDAAMINGRNYTTHPFRYTMNFIRQYMVNDAVEISVRSENDSFYVSGGLDGSGRKHFIACLSPLV